MSSYTQVIFWSLIGGIVSLIGGLLLLSRRSLATKLANYATPFAAGALIAAAFFDLFKEGIHEAGDNFEPVLYAAVAGILLFFLLERFLHWFHHHHEHQGTSKPSSVLVIVGDTVHNALDGIAIAAAFLVSPSTGIITTLAVAAHEIPQEIGDFAILLKNGMSRRRVLLANFVSALATTIAAVITFALGNREILPIPALLGLTAGFFIYIALSDIVPTIHEESKHRAWDVRPWLLILGVLVVGLLSAAAHSFIENDQHEQKGECAQHSCDK